MNVNPIAMATARPMLAIRTTTAMAFLTNAMPTRAVWSGSIAMATACWTRVIQTVTGTARSMLATLTTTAMVLLTNAMPTRAA